MQDLRSQPVSHASQTLAQTALDLYADGDLHVLDLGSGCGILGIMLALQRPGWRIEGLELQENLHSLAWENAHRCGVPIKLTRGDLREFTNSETFDLIVSNPPWQPAGSGRYSPHQGRNLSRFELECTLADVLDCLRRNLSPHGEALVLYPEKRIAALQDGAAKSLLDIIGLFAASGLKKHLICRLRLKGNDR